MLSPPCILLYGHDERLLETRRWILEKSDFQVRTVWSILALNETISGCQVDILILCHSLSSKECERALAMVHMHSPEIKSVVLTASDTICADATAVGDKVLDTWEGPTVLLNTIQKLVCRPDAA